MEARAAEANNGTSSYQLTDEAVRYILSIQNSDAKTCHATNIKGGQGGRRGSLF